MHGCFMHRPDLDRVLPATLPVVPVDTTVEEDPEELIEDAEEPELSVPVGLIVTPVELACADARFEALARLLQF